MAGWCPWEACLYLNSNKGGDEWKDWRGEVRERNWEERKEGNLWLGCKNKLTTKRRCWLLVMPAWRLSHGAQCLLLTPFVSWFRSEASRHKATGAWDNQEGFWGLLPYFTNLKGIFALSYSFYSWKPFVLVWLIVWMCGTSSVQNGTGSVVSFQSFVDQNCPHFRDSSNNFVCKSEELIVHSATVFWWWLQIGLTTSVNVTRTKCRCHVHLTTSTQDPFQDFT